MSWVLAGVAAGVGIVPAPARADPNGSTTTAVAGGLISAPTGVPTSFDPTTYDFTGYCPELWTGSWTGTSVCHFTYAHVDPSTGDFVATLTDSFTGAFVGDHSVGTLTIQESLTGNLLLGMGLLEGDIVAGGGDSTFGCSTGHITLPFYINPAFVYGGYAGTWIHACPT